MAHLIQNECRASGSGAPGSLRNVRFPCIATCRARGRVVFPLAENGFRDENGVSPNLLGCETEMSIDFPLGFSESTPTLARGLGCRCGYGMCSGACRGQQIESSKNEFRRNRILQVNPREMVISKQLSFWTILILLF